MNLLLKKGLWIYIKILIIGYLIIGLILFLIQDLILFHPISLKADHRFSFDTPFREKNMQVGKRNLNLVEFTVEGVPKGIVLYFHGNRRNIERYEKFISPFIKLGYEVWMPDYAGFGKSTGKLSEKNMYEDAGLLFRLAKKTAAKDIIIYGKSLGTGVAAQLASVNECKQLILETPYYSIPSVAASRFPIYPASLMSKYRFPTFEYLPKVKAPVTIFHGTSDEVIPYTQSKKLKMENPGVQLITIEGGRHNNLFGYEQYQSILSQLLNY
jgi:alpha-beta hydrolase superfamily lysophospholipase